jgi:hypothetical protein
MGWRCRAGGQHPVVHVSSPRISSRSRRNVSQWAFKLAAAPRRTICTGMTSHPWIQIPSHFRHTDTPQTFFFFFAPSEIGCTLASSPVIADSRNSIPSVVNEGVKEHSRNAEFSSFRHIDTQHAQTLWCPVLCTFRMEQWFAGLPNSVTALNLRSYPTVLCWADRCRIRCARSFNNVWNICAPFSDILSLITSSSYTSTSLRWFSMEKWSSAHFTEQRYRIVPGTKFPMPLPLHMDFCPD